MYALEDNSYLAFMISYISQVSKVSYRVNMCTTYFKILYWHACEKVACPSNTLAWQKSGYATGLDADFRNSNTATTLVKQSHLYRAVCLTKQTIILISIFKKIK